LEDVFERRGRREETRLGSVADGVRGDDGDRSTRVAMCLTTTA